MAVKTCPNCGTPTAQYSNYCAKGFACMIEFAKRQGGKVIAPNGLPIKCIRWDNAMLEHEHADHPTYLFPVSVEYIAPIRAEDIEDFEAITGKQPEDDEAVRGLNRQSHALIYTDYRSVALTLYEACFAMCYLSDGEVGGGSLWDKGKWRLSRADCDKIRSLRHG